MWTPERPLKEIDDEDVRNIFVEEARYMLGSLENKLKIEAVENKREGYHSRKVTNKNPAWYSELWEKNIFYNGRRKYDKTKKAKRKKSDSYIRRDRIEGVLIKLIKLEDKPSHNNEYRLREFMQRRFTEGYEEWGKYFPQNVKVCEYFKVKINKETRRMLKSLKESSEEKNMRELTYFFEKQKENA